MAATYKLSQAYKVGEKNFSELKVETEDGVVRTGLVLQLLSEFQMTFPGIYEASRFKIQEEHFLTLALAKFNGLSLEELNELPVTEWLPAIAEVASNFLKKSGETKN